MSTHCQIRVEGHPVLFFIHFDGYPAGILPQLMPFLKEFVSGRCMEASTVLARVGQMFMNAHDKRRAKGYEKQPDLPPSPYDFDSFGYGTEIYGDARYLYTLKSDYTVEVEVLALDRHKDRPVKPKQHGKCWYYSLGVFPSDSKVEEAVATCKQNL